jgi:phosphoadenosine phosphosulfate reductase
MTAEVLQEIDKLSADAVIDRVLRENPGTACITCSFQVEDMAVLDMLRHRVAGLPVLFLDTGYHFAETYAYRDRMAAAWKLNVVNLRAAATVEQQEKQFGLLYRSNPTECCRLRKVGPLMSGLENFEIWFTGLRREQSPTRAHLQKIEHHILPSGKKLLKVSPLADWKWDQVLKYVDENHIERLPLYHLGYTSIGCEPCTSVPSNSADPRSGRWQGKKLECGIHTFTERR